MCSFVLQLDWAETWNSCMAAEYSKVLVKRTTFTMLHPGIAFILVPRNRCKSVIRVFFLQVG